MKQQFLLLALAVLPFGIASAQSPKPATHQDKDLFNLFLRLKKADSVSYTSEMAYYDVQKPKQVYRVKSINYRSNNPVVVYSKSSEQIFYLAHNGLFKLSDADKTVWYKVFANDSEYNYYTKLYAPATDPYKDSTFWATAIIAKKTLTKKYSHYQLSFKHPQMKGMSLSVPANAILPDSISYAMENYFNDDKSLLMRQEVKAFNYKTEIPEELKTLLAQYDLLGFMQKEFKAYKIIKF